MIKNALKFISLFTLFVFVLALSGKVLAEQGSTTGEHTTVPVTDTTNPTPTPEITHDGRFVNTGNLRDGKGQGDQGQGNGQGSQGSGDQKPKLLNTTARTIKTKCEIVTTNVTNRIQTFNDNKDKHASRYSELKTKFADLISKLKDRGYDTTKLEADAAVLDTKIQQFTDDYALFIQKLEAVKTFACGQSQGAFLDALNVAKDQLKIVKQDVLDIRAYFNDTVKPDITAIRAHTPDNSTSQNQ